MEDYGRALTAYSWPDMPPSPADKVADMAGKQAQPHSAAHREKYACILIRDMFDSVTNIFQSISKIKAQNLTAA